MTTDRTAATIRRHLLETADERPADGQLDASLRLTSAIPQRSRWVVALRDLRRPTATAPRIAIRLALLAALLIVAAAGIAALGGGSKGGTPFEGTWTSTDPGDGSRQTLVVGPGMTPTVHFEDAFSIMCAQAGDASTLFEAAGPGVIEGSRLTANFGDSGCVTWRVPDLTIALDYNASADTVIDDTGIIWHRQP